MIRLGTTCISQPKAVFQNEIIKDIHEKAAATSCGSYHQNITQVYTLSTHDDDHMNR